MLDRARYLCQPLSEGLLVDLNFTDFILSRETIIAQQDYICGKVGAPTTIIQFFEDNGAWERIDSQVSAISLRTSCDLLRRCVNDDGKFCCECDAEHASIFHELNKDQIASNDLEARIKLVTATMYDKYTNAHHNLNPDYKHDHMFIAYNCPMFGYRELMFPIFYRDKVIAVFVVGQIKLEGNDKIINASKKNFFKTRTHLFNEYIHKCKEKRLCFDNPSDFTNKAISNYIIEHSRRGTSLKYPEVYKLKPGMQIPKIDDQLNNENYEKIISDICEWLNKLEDLLIIEMKKKYEYNIRSILIEEQSLFKIDFGDHDNALASPNDLWERMNQFAQNVKDKCLLEYLVVYGANSLFDKRKVFKLGIVAKSSSLVENNPPSSFSLTLAPVNSLMYEPTNSKITPGLFKALNPSYLVERDKMSIFYQPRKDISAASVMILIKFQDNSYKEAVEEVLLSGLQYFVTLISTSIAARFENIAQTHFEKSLRLYKHEMVNLVSGVSRAIDGYLGNPKLKEMDKAKIESVYLDSSSTLRMFEFLSENTGILVNELLPVNVRNVFIYKEQIHKWEIIKRIDAGDKGCDILYDKSDLSLKTDPRYLELVVYNLLTNAVKYSYDNTNIYIHCKKTENEKSYVLTVLSFSFPINDSENDKIFSMGYRSWYAKNYYPDGSGIGLWIVKVVMEHLGGDIQLCKSKLISNYNIPALYSYINNPTRYNINSTSFQKAKIEYNNLINENVDNEIGGIVNKIAWVVSNINTIRLARSQVEEELLNATYSTRFEVIFNEQNSIV